MLAHHGDAGGVAHVGRVGFCEPLCGVDGVDLVGRAPRVRLLAADDSHPRAIPGQPQGDGVADAAARAGDDGDLLSERGRVFGVHGSKGRKRVETRGDKGEVVGGSRCNDDGTGKQVPSRPVKKHDNPRLRWDGSRLNTRYFHCFAPVVAVRRIARGLELEVDPDLRERLRVEVPREDVIARPGKRRGRFFPGG